MARLKNRKKLNIGCGPDWEVLYPDHEGLDIIDYGQKWVGDVLDLIGKMEPGNYDEVMANHFMEHFDQEELKVVFNGVWRALSVNGIFKFVVPHMKKERAFILSHKTYWNETVVRWLGEVEARDVYGFGSWAIDDVVTNKREDIHAWLRKV